MFRLRPQGLVARGSQKGHILCGWYPFPDRTSPSHRQFASIPARGERGDPVDTFEEVFCRLPDDLPEEKFNLISQYLTRYKETVRLFKDFTKKDVSIAMADMEQMISELVPYTKQKDIEMVQDLHKWYLSLPDDHPDVAVRDGIRALEALDIRIPQGVPAEVYCKDEIEGFWDPYKLCYRPYPGSNLERKMREDSDPPSIAEIIPGKYYYHDFNKDQTFSQRKLTFPNPILDNDWEEKYSLPIEERELEDSLV